MEWEKLHYSGIRTHDNCNTSQTHQPLKNARQATNNSGDDHPEYQSATQTPDRRKWEMRNGNSGSGEMEEGTLLFCYSMSIHALTVRSFLPASWHKRNTQQLCIMVCKLIFFIIVNCSYLPTLDFFMQCTDIQYLSHNTIIVLMELCKMPVWECVNYSSHAQSGGNVQTYCDKVNTLQFSATVSADLCLVLIYAYCFPTRRTTMHMSLHCPLLHCLAYTRPPHSCVCASISPFPHFPFLISHFPFLLLEWPSLVPSRK